MLHKKNLHIPKLMWTIMNKLVTIMKIVELDIRLTEGTWLNVGVPYSSMVMKELVENIPDCPESYLMVRYGLDGNNGDVRVATGGPPENHPGHHLAVWHHHTIETPGDERRRINELECHWTVFTLGG
jgi:hypothetical protein